MGIVGTVFHPGKMPLQNVSYAAPFGPIEPRVVSKVINEMHEKVPAMRKSWEKYNQVYLCGFALDDYGVVATTAVTKLEDLKGKKFGGPPGLHGWIKGSGAVAVNAGPTPRPASVPCTRAACRSTKGAGTNSRPR